MEDYINPGHQPCLEFNHLNSFDRLWSCKVDWFEEPNRDRGGWSGIGRIVFRLPDESERGMFLKRQENHPRRSFRHPFRGEPTLACEFRMMRFLHAQGVPAPEPVFFGQRYTEGSLRAILMTEELLGFNSLEEVAEGLFAQGRPPLELQRSIMRAVAATVRKLHAARIQHRSLYPKHLFVKFQAQGDPQVVVIDLEKSRARLFFSWCMVYDLETLNRRSLGWSRTARLYFLKQYLGVNRLTFWQKLMCRIIVGRSRRRKK